ncbi:hypothetical protein [Brevibacillus dissolubilis]|uniref:hypothetical protein n=1 Tax=Brevibacillus dissolubilis TaxID=1844116 RepID=UPI001116CDC6|nr:hypothetical protein [Brevibacillus dissolubilis]
MLDYLQKNGLKAYREIKTLTEQPDFLFSSDPALMKSEACHNYRYIHGLSRLLHKNRITNDQTVHILMYVEKSLERYVRKHYRDKKFVFHIYADALIPAFTVWMTSDHEGEAESESEEASSSVTTLPEMVRWFTEHAFFNGIPIMEGNDGEDSTSPNHDHYSNVIQT